MKALISQLKGPRQVKTNEKLRSAQVRQTALLSRLDRILQDLTKKANPELSDYETKWFEELKRMREEIMGIGRYDDSSLTARAGLVCASHW